ncbi:13809_t:CDS:2 [Entrophospora sp. SA101]|nr:13809_t:CDS:2 [Entrophospora sp. SA101]
MSQPPVRSDRELCWKLRDEYFKCLGEIDPTTVNNDESIKSLVKKNGCWKIKGAYEDKCIASWVRVNDG